MTRCGEKASKHSVRSSTTMTEHGHHHHDDHDHAIGAGHAHAPKDFGVAFAVGVALNLGFVLVEIIYGLFVNGQAPTQSDTVRSWLFALLAVGAGRMALSFAQRMARSRRLVGQPGLR